MLRVATLSFRTKIWFIYSIFVTIIMVTVLTVNNFDSEFSNDHHSSNELQDNTLNLTVQNGDSFGSILKSNKVDEQDISLIVSALRKVYNPAKMNIGQNISLFYENYLDQNEETKKYLNAIRISVTPTKAIEIYRNRNSGFEVKEMTIQLERYLTHVSSEINTSLFGAAKQQEVPINIIGEMAKILSYDVDFQREIQKGDKFSVIYETFYDQQGNFAMYGKPLFVSANIGDREIRLYYYENEDGHYDYYNLQGSSVRKDLLRTPINATRISSGFGVRVHPILGFSKMHNGVDFPASIGTPIYAAGDGIIQEIGRKGSYGNYIKIRHNNTYATAYAHISRFSKNLKRGSKVKQGDVIALVGSTGRSSGPHLHYEVHVNGKQVNPLSVKLVSNKKIDNKSFKNFKEYVKIINDKILSTPTRTETSAKYINKYI